MHIMYFLSYLNSLALKKMNILIMHILALDKILRWNHAFSVNQQHLQGRSSTFPEESLPRVKEFIDPLRVIVIQ